MRKIIHCDADCFFAALEIRDDPSLRHRPIAVGGDADKRGVISTCNYEARRFGIRSAMASATAKRLCPDLIILPHRMEVYRATSARMRQIFYEYTELVEPLSLDEAFLDVTNSDYCRGSATLIAEEIRRKIKTELGITVSAGVAPNKFLAKVASDWNKPDGVFVVTPQRIETFVAQLSVRKIHGVGKATAERLEEQGVKTCKDLQRYSIYELSQHYGQFGQRLFDLCRGKDERPVTPGRRRKSLSVEQTYSQDLPDLMNCQNQLPELLRTLIDRLKKLDDEYRVVKIFVKIKFANFSITTAERSGSVINSDDFAALCEQAFARGKRPVRLIGVGVRFVDLREDKAFYQLDLFQ